jgi:hypothetical protein
MRLQIIVLTRGFAAIAAFAAFCAVGYDYVAGHWTCSQDTSNCALSHVKDGYYAGVVIDPRTQQRVANRRLNVYFESRRDYGVVVTTDSDGRYCIVWAQEHVYPDAHIGPRYDLSLHADWQPLRQGPPPRGCEISDTTIPWNRAADLRTRWQYKSVLWIGGGALLALAISILTNAAVLKPALRALGMSAAVGALVMCIAVWS